MISSLLNQLRTVFFGFVFFFFSFEFFAFSQEQISEAEIFYVQETGIILDTLDNKIVLHFDENEKPSYYFSEIFTPVCLSSDCLPIRINLYWTLAGTYLKYTLTNGEILTKVDHIHFTPEDYFKLDQILKNKISTLKYLNKEDFPFQNSSDTTKKVDGMTGATSRVSKRDFIEGAIYTSLTLYQLANGAAVQQMKSFTLKNIIQNENVNFFLEHTDRETSDLGFEFMKLNLTENEMLAFILDQMNSTSKQIVDLAVCYLPYSSIQIDSVENKMAEIYQADFTSDQTRTRLLELWTGNQLLGETQVILSKGLLKYRENFVSVLSIIDSQFSWHNDVYNLLCDAVFEETNLSRREKIYRVIIRRKKDFPKEAKKKVSEMEKVNGWN